MSKHIVHQSDVLKKDKNNNEEKSKSQAQLAAEASLLIKEEVKICDENAKRALELQKEETRVRIEECKRNNDMVM